MVDPVELDGNEKWGRQSKWIAEIYRLPSVAIYKEVAK